MGKLITCSRLFPDNTLHMVTSKYQKTDEKSQLGVHISPSVLVFLNDKPTTTIPLSVM